MTKLLFTSRNQGKIEEVKKLLSTVDVQVLSPEDLNIPTDFDVDETGVSFKENAQLKALGYGKISQILSLADDSGLQVSALENRPGVFSKRYGDSDAQRISRVLSELKASGSSNRSAEFVCEMSLYDPTLDKLWFAKGIVTGTISPVPTGEFGFGYDPIFIPDEGDGRTFAEYGSEFKNQISHRSRALKDIKKILENQVSIK